MIFRFAALAGLAILLALALLFTSSQMGAAVVREKDQRAMEMIITSLKPSQLVAGKVMGMSLLSLTQIAVWGLGALIGLGLFLAGQVDLGNISVPWGALLWALLLGVPGYFLYAVIASGYVDHADLIHSIPEPVPSGCSRPMPVKIRPRLPWRGTKSTLLCCTGRLPPTRGCPARESGLAGHAAGYPMVQLGLGGQSLPGGHHGSNNPLELAVQQHRT